MSPAAVRAAAAPSPSGADLESWPVVRPREGQRRILAYADARARAVLELGSVTISLRAAPSSCPRGQMVRRGNGRGPAPEVLLRCDLGGAELAEALWHQLAHVGQLSSGRWSRLSDEAREAEAHGFVARMMAGAA